VDPPILSGIAQFSAPTHASFTIQLAVYNNVANPKGLNDEVVNVRFILQRETLDE
jgi:hypothetical protein